MSPPHDPEDVTGARREIIVSIVRLKPNSTCQEILAELTALHEKGDWPQATWAWARNAPYQLGLYQHLTALKRMKRIGAFDDDGLTRYRPNDAYRKRAAEVLRLRDEGLKGTQIAERLGISRSLAASLLKDPTGEKERLRKKAYCGTCGAKKRAQDRRELLSIGQQCGCALLDAPLALDGVRRYEHEQGCPVVLGVTPSLVRVVRIGTQRGVVEHQLPNTQTWWEALEEVGIA